MCNTIIISKGQSFLGVISLWPWSHLYFYAKSDVSRRITLTKSVNKYQAISDCMLSKVHKSYVIYFHCNNRQFDNRAFVVFYIQINKILWYWFLSYRAVTVWMRDRAHWPEPLLDSPKEFQARGFKKVTYNHH